MKHITRTVWILSLVSLFTDAASEMLYPIMPIYLKSIGFSLVLIGVLEGLTEATAGLSKGYFGKKSDASGRRVPFVQLGYLLSSFSKPMMGVLTAPLWIFFARTFDRLGKGIRTGARDAMLSDEATPATKGTVFGFHRSMDTMGAVLGPAIALVYLQYFPGQYRPLFFIAFAPALLAIGISLLLKDKQYSIVPNARPVSFFAFLEYWKVSPARYRTVARGLLVFALFNSSDVFLLLRARSVGLNDGQTITLYIFYNLVFALCSLPLGILADRIGLKRIFVLGLVLFSCVYYGMAIGGGLWFFAALFFVYGLSAAATDGIAKAWITNISDAKDTATAVGTYSGFQSVCALFASSLAGLLWTVFGPAVCFTVTGIMTTIVVVYMLLLRGSDHLPTAPNTILKA